VPDQQRVDLVSVAAEPVKAPRSVTTAICPCCGSGNRSVGLLRAGEHLVWRVHYYTTWSGASMPCRASAVAVCSPLAKPLGQREYAKERREAVCTHEPAAAAEVLPG